MTLKTMWITAGLLGTVLLVAGCGTTSSRFSQTLGKLTPSAGGLPKHDQRDLAAAVEKDPFPKASQLKTRVANANVIVQQ